MAAPSLFLRHVFGLKGSVKDNIHFLEDVTVVYPAGRNVIVYNTEQKTQRFIAGTPESDGISAIAISANRKLIAVAEKPLSSRGTVTPSKAHQEVYSEKSTIIQSHSETTRSGSLGSLTGHVNEAGISGAMITIYDATSLKKRKVNLSTRECCIG
jgi:mRNA degradation ribonuclease J1/J2